MEVDDHNEMGSEFEPIEFHITSENGWQCGAQLEIGITCKSF